MVAKCIGRLVWKLVRSFEIHRDFAKTCGGARWDAMAVNGDRCSILIAKLFGGL